MRTALLFAAPLLLAGAVSGAPVTTNVASGCVDTYDATVDYFPEKVTASETDGWTIKYEKSYKVLNNTLAGEAYVLYQCGTPKPNVTGVDKAFAVPITKAAISDTTAVTYFELLGKLSAIDYVDAASIGLVVSPCFLKDEAAKGVSAFATNETLKAEQEAAMDVVTDFMANEVPNSIAWSASMGDNAARRNYIKFLSAFLNLEGTANTVASNLAANYECVKSASVAASGATKPVMAFVEYQAPSDYNNQTAIYQINMPAYKAEFIADVGAVAPVTKTTKFTDSAAFLEAIKNVEYLVDETFIGTSSFDDLLTTYKLTSGSALPFVAKKQVYRTDKLQNAEGWTAWFESAVALNNLVLSDFASLIHPSAFPSYQRTFVRNVATEALSTATVSAASQCGAVTMTGQCSAGTPTANAVPTTTASKPASAGKTQAGLAMAIFAGVAALLL